MQKRLSRIRKELNIMTRKTRVVVLTQEDSFVIPKNIKLLGEMENIDLVAVIKIDAAGSLVNKKNLFIRGFGLFQVGKMGLLSLFNTIVNIIDSCFFFKLGFLKSLNSVAVACKSRYLIMSDPNDKSNIDCLKNLNIELIVSYSAPCIFKNELLELPKFGCINLHCSLLPKYAGILPSFWTLYEKSETFGVTVHKMDDKIDNGEILGQVQVSMPVRPSMYRVIIETKRVGGHLMISVINKILCGNLSVQPNNAGTKDYFSWPTIDQIKAFRREGGRLI